MIDKYDVEYMGVKCTGVDWTHSVFYFTKDENEYTYMQTKAVDCNADTDHIRCVIEEQFLPWWKDERIKELEEENAKLKDKWDNLRCVYSYDGEVMEYCVNGPCPNDRSVSEVREENAELKARLASAIELPCRCGDTVYAVETIAGVFALLKGRCDRITYEDDVVPRVTVWATFEDEWALRPRMFYGKGLNNLFRTHAEAEARLTELKNDTQRTT